MDLWTLYLLSQGGGGDTSVYINVINEALDLDIAADATTVSIATELGALKSAKDAAEADVEYGYTRLGQVYSNTVTPPPAYETYNEMREAVADNEAIYDILENLYLGVES